MKTSGLKSTVIVILLIVNAFLLFLRLDRSAQKRAAYERSVDQLVALCERSGIALSPALLPGETRLGTIHHARDLAAEAAFARALLGEDAAALAAGGGIYRYQNAHGSCLLRAGGAVEAALDLTVDDPQAFCTSLFAAFGYAQQTALPPGNSGDAVGIRTLDDGPVFNAELRLTFSDGHLTAANGTFLPSAAPAEASEGVDAISALTRFLDYSTVSGTVCTEIRAIRNGYLLQSTASTALSLVPAWRIVTDAGNYYVNYVTGEVSRE